MPDYQKGMIYKIVALNCEDPDEVYYGSTTQPLAKRMWGHKGGYKSWTEGKGNLITSYILFEKYDFQNCKIILVQNFPCNSKYELEAKEAEHILNNKCLNKYMPNRTVKDWRRDNAEYVKAYDKYRRLQNADKIRECKKQYRSKNADKIKEHKKQYYIDNADKFNEKISCACGGIHIRKGKSKHLKTIKHQTFLSNQTEPTPS